MKVRSNKVTKSQCCLSVVRHKFYGSFWTQNSMVTLIFKFDQRKGQLQVKLGQIRSNFKLQNFITKICPSCAVLSQDSKKYIYFYVRQLKMPEIAFQLGIWTHYLYLFFFWPLHSQKQRYCLEILYACCLYVSDHIYSGFLDNWKFFDVIGNYFWKKWNFEFWGQNKKYEKYEIATL